MCLTINKEKTEELRNSKQKFVTRYKLLRKEDDKYKSFFYHNFTWKQGYNKACPDTETPPTPYTIYGGVIHVFISRVAAEKFLYFRTGIVIPSYVRIIPVQCYIKDLVAVGVFETFFLHALAVPYIPSEAYSQVYVEELCA